MSDCPIPFETLADHWAGEAVADDVEEHLFTCAECSARSERVAVVVTSLRQQVPPIVSRERLQRLAERGRRFVDTDVQPGATESVVFAREADMLIHHLRGDFRAAVAVDCQVLGVDGGLLLELERVPFDRERGELLIACQRHMMDLGPPHIVFRVTTVGPAGERREQRYGVIHLLDPRDR